MRSEYRPTIGIEVHAELKTKTKMFCGCKNDPHGGAPNAHTCPVCMAHPGTLPVINKEAVRHVLTVGSALKAKLADFTEFDRKNYFYPDIPKGYQISQYKYPLVSGGELAGVAITRVHLEEDTARSQHDQTAGSLVDYNRAGVPLMELVTEPVIHDAATAATFAKELQLLLRTLGVSGANMERGEMRVEANISVSKTNTFGTKVEVKNLNSFKAVEGAIIYEIERQVELLERGEQVTQETRGWDENRGKTFSQRIKESADDYRYFPDPDLPKLSLRSVPDFSLSRIEESMPVLPSEKRIKYGKLGLTREQVETIISDTSLNVFFDCVLENGHDDERIARTSANYLTTDILALLNEQTELQIDAAPLFYKLVCLVTESKVTSRVAKDLLPRVLFEHEDPEIIAEREGLLQNNSEEALSVVIESVIEGNVAVVDEYRNGKEAALQFLVGQGMKATKGSANPGLLAELFRKKIQGK